MSRYRDLWSQVLAEVSDQNQQSISTTTLIQWTELALFIIQLVLRAQTRTVNVTYPSELLLTPYEFVPVFNIHSFVDSSGVALEDFMLMLAVRDANGKELSQGSLETIRSLRLIWQNAATPIDYYIVSTNLLCVRQPPTVDVTLGLTYIPYLSVDTLEEEWPLEVEHEHMMLHILRMLYAIRIGHYKLAAENLKRFIAYATRR